MLTLIQCYVVFFTFTCNKFYCLSHEGDKWNEILTTRKSSSGRAHWWRNGRDNKAKHGSSLIWHSFAKIETFKAHHNSFRLNLSNAFHCMLMTTNNGIDSNSYTFVQVRWHNQAQTGTFKPELAMKRSKWTVINANVNISTRKNNGFARWYEFKPQIIVTFAL